MGGGYYDRFLAKAKSADVIGVAFDCQKVKRILAQTHDVPLTKVITENKLSPALNAGLSH